MKVHTDQRVRALSYTLKVPCTVLYRVQTPCGRDISPQIDLMYSCFLEERTHSPLINKKFHEMLAEIPWVNWEKSRYGKVRGVIFQVGLTSRIEYV